MQPRPPLSTRPSQSKGRARKSSQKQQQEEEEDVLLAGSASEEHRVLKGKRASVGRSKQTKSHPLGKKNRQTHHRGLSESTDDPSESDAAQCKFRLGRRRRKSPTSSVTLKATTTYHSPTGRQVARETTSAEDIVRVVSKETTSDSGSNDVYGYIPSDEEDLTHPKTRLYSPETEEHFEEDINCEIQTDETATRAAEEARGRRGGGRERERSGQRD